MKIVVLTDGIPPEKIGGAERVAWQTAKEFKKTGHQVSIITATQKEGSQKKIKRDGIEIFQIYSDYHPRWRHWLSIYNRRAIKKIKKILKEIRPNVVQVHNIHQYLSYASLKVAKKHTQKVFLTVHDLMLVAYGKIYPQAKNSTLKISFREQIKEARKRYNPFRNLIIKYYLQFVDKIFAVSQSLRKALEANGIKNIVVIHNGLNTNEWLIKDEKKLENFKVKNNLNNKKVIFFGGRLSAAKGGDNILKALKIVRKNKKKITLLIAGGDNKYVSKMKKLVKKMQLDSNVIFLGRLTAKEMSLAYHSSILSLSPSLCFETFGMTNLEAMACGKPVITGHFGGPTEVVVNGETGFLIDPNNIQKLADKIIELVSDEDKANTFGEKGLQRVKELFSIKRQVQEMLKIYEK